MAETMDSLCVQCGKACTKGCDWSRDFTPVDEWTAIKTDKSYLVIACPDYVEDEPIRDIDTDGMLRLLEALGKQINDDYVCGTPQMRRVIEQDLRYGPARNLLQFNDIDSVIMKLRKLAKVRDEEAARRCAKP